MKRDMICIAEIIRKIEKMAYQGDQPPRTFKIKGYSKGIVDYHIQLLKDADFIKTAVNSKNRELPTRLTWKCHEYMLQSLNDSAIIIDEGISLSVEMDM